MTKILNEDIILTEQEEPIVDRLMGLYRNNSVAYRAIEAELAKPSSERDWKSCESKCWMLHNSAKSSYLY